MALYISLHTRTFNQIISDISRHSNQTHLFPGFYYMQVIYCYNQPLKNPKSEVLLFYYLSSGVSIAVLTVQSPGRICRVVWKKSSEYDQEQGDDDRVGCKSERSLNKLLSMTDWFSFDITRTDPKNNFCTKKKLYNTYEWFALSIIICKLLYILYLNTVAHFSCM